MSQQPGGGVMRGGFAGVRPCAVAGTFYPAVPEVLREAVVGYLPDVSEAPKPKALVVPHAGYIYSGVVAGQAFALLRSTGVSRVLLLGPAHRVAFAGMAVPQAGRFATPLGEVEVDRAMLQAALAQPDVKVGDLPHAQEHALEVQLPFLQTVLDEFSVLPVVVGEVAPARVAALIDLLWDGPETLIVVSSDLSHYLPYSAAVERDAATLRRILAGRADLRHDEACGATPLNGLLLAAEAHGLRTELVAHCNSGDTAGDRRRVVGYASLRFTEAVCDA